MAFIFVALTAIVPHTPAQAADVICYNCPPEWADWATMLKAIKADLGYDIPFDNKNSGQALAQIIAEKANPVGDIVYFGVTFGMKAKAAGDLIEPYKPKLSDQVPAGLKDPDGYWTTIHSGTLGLFVNKDALGGKPVPACWKDLLKPDYKGMVGYLDPSSAAVGYVGAVAINLALGGSDSDIDAGDRFLQGAAQERADRAEADVLCARRLRRNPDPARLRLQRLSRQISARAAISNSSFPAKARWCFPMSTASSRTRRTRRRRKKVLDYFLSDKGQAIWANAYLRPARPIELPAAVKAKFLPDSDYARAKSVDWGKMEALQRGFVDRYLAEVRMMQSWRLRLSRSTNRS